MSEHNFETFRRDMRQTACEMCGNEGSCVLHLTGNRYLWICADGCDEVWQISLDQGLPQ